MTSVYYAKNIFISKFFIAFIDIKINSIATHSIVLFMIYVGRILIFCIPNHHKFFYIHWNLKENFACNSLSLILMIKSMYKFKIFCRYLLAKMI